MRLLELGSRGEVKSSKNFVGEEIPRYAILSHTWGPDDEEVTFNDLQNGSDKSKAGYAKIRFCGEQARSDDLQYFWVDTCCIDKANHTELSEAITSMFAWYRDATKCYVYLSDVSARTGDSSSENRQPWEPAFRTSKRFTRGWTLQEIIALNQVEFFSREGEFLGDKGLLGQQIFQITKVPIAALRGAAMSDFTVEERLQWAANRKTKRREDKAYCLLGIFDVFLPLIYGEGDNAYIRLKREIAKSSKLHPRIESSEYKARDNILRSLWYPRMRERVDQIQEAHGVTYKWMLEDDVKDTSTSTTSIRPQGSTEPASSHFTNDWENAVELAKYLRRVQNMPHEDIWMYMELHHSFEADSDDMDWLITIVRKEEKRGWRVRKPEQYVARNHGFRRQGYANKMRRTWDIFSTWLKSKDPPKSIYWISGKVGSGKSTLMRYLDSNIDQNEHMEPWAAGLCVLKARYFFWNPAESSLQKSFVGLLRSLLCQLLEQSVEFTDSCEPREKWKHAQIDDKPLEWTRVELQETMKKFLDSTYRSSRILLIIDGLDEAEGSSEDTEMLMLFLEETSKHDHVKVCVSSRPCIMFQDAFQGCPKLELEKLTYTDIQSYVLETLTSHRRFRYVQRLDPLGSEHLANRIVEKAEGVFLWAKLVVKELLQNLRDALPTDGRFSAVPYRKEASMLFQIALHHEQHFTAANPLRLLDLSFLDAAGTDFALEWQPERGGLDFTYREGILFRLDSTLRKLNSRCLGILECFYYPGEAARQVSVGEDLFEPPLTSSVMHAESLDETVFLPIIHEVASMRQHKLFPFDFGVDFLHRSLRDYMMSDGLQRLRQGSSDDFDPRNYLRNARLIQAQQIQAAGLCTPLATGFCSYVLSTLGLPKYRSSTASAQLAQRICNTVESIPESDDYCPSFCFLTVAIDFGLESYIQGGYTQGRIYRGSILGKRGRPILDYILRPRFGAVYYHTLQTGYHSPSIELIQCALNDGSDPNEQWNGPSVWALFLCFIATVVKDVNSPEKERQDYFVALVALIQHGASRMIPKSWLSVGAYLEMVEPPWPLIEDTAGKRFESRWGAVGNALAGDGNDNPLYDVRDLVECFVHPHIFDLQQVKQLQLLVDEQQRDEAGCTTSEPRQHQLNLKEGSDARLGLGTKC
ncbi:hypothetical protein LTR10_013396 [Elasticomyces elasticus]|uniref:NACHT domain-containing protein n=1 Tax=Exophiala sideris TaxID=1016849 RepID=A0ABR0J4J2_9EURO|nr:hypothetical protein LTR10_013396 [Elasticomyces elasticus]KAK5027374.1 hypothetical protein LTS07_006976 [Exophiala sideris]KAK5034924.1 hypothetical protein LTR13_006106 [Exophiala sideris]KAK5056342.1 hypothetical protein LTR69_007883 [Exophiala sideris]KAK5181169.1 hypothetical protein LTR44_006500 [Eurotiomycetes sp. CCFEE 6388]